MNKLAKNFSRTSNHLERWNIDVSESEPKIAAQISHEQIRQELLANLK